MRRIVKAAVAAGAASAGVVLGLGGIAAADGHGYTNVVDTDVFTATFVRNGEELACDVYGESEILWNDDPVDQSQVFASTQLLQPADPRCEDAIRTTSAGGDYTGNPDGGVDSWMSYGSDYASGTVVERFDVTGLEAFHGVSFSCDDAAQNGQCWFQFTTSPK